MDRLLAMRTFVEIVDGGSLTAAAGAMNRSVPAVVRTLAGLESMLGVTLLRRTTRRMSLTPEGHEYLGRARQILAAVAEAESHMGQARETPSGELRLTAPVLFGQLHLAPLLGEVLSRHPALQVDLLLLDRNVNLVEEGIDLALRIGELSDSSMIASRVGWMRRVVCASPGRLRLDGVPEHPRELSTRACLRFSGLTAGDSWRFSMRGRPLRVQVSGSFRCNQVQAIASACADGVGYGQFLAYQVAPLIEEGVLRVVLTDFEPAPLPVNLVYPGGRVLTSRLRAVLETLRPAMAQRLAAVEAMLEPGASGSRRETKKSARRKPSVRPPS
jgi:DNA-binding transcriptional LysR family regulator